MRILLALAISLLFAACGDTSSEQSESVTAPAAAEATLPQSSGITLTPKAPGTDFPDATITKWQYLDGKFDYDYKADSYVLGEQSPDADQTMCANSGKGQHIHLIVDNEPYIAKYESEFEHAIPDGEHRILTFLSRSYHESIKTANAHRAVVVQAEGGNFMREKPLNDPMLFYSRPKGTYTGKDTESILLDFYPVNAPLGDKYKVKVDANGTQFTIDEWQPYVLKGLPMGENTVTLTLVDGYGAVVDAPYNPVSRTFTLAADPLDK